MPADQLLFLSVSATSNVGLSHDALSLVTWPLGTLSILMLLGRAVPFLVLWWMAETTDGAETLVA
jgi:Trk-type K+ transport system membrane component